MGASPRTVFLPVSLRTIFLAQWLSEHLVLVPDQNINVYIQSFKSAKNMKANRAESHARITPVAGVAQEGDPYNFHSLLSAQLATEISI